jgi:hypothetical protein
MPHIAILIHKHNTFVNTPFLLNRIAENWQEMGFRVSVTNDPNARIDADLAALHVDLTVVPEDYLTFISRYPVAINAAVIDISKRLISSNLVSRGDGYKGEIIVKTNLNFGGYPEQMIAEKGPRLLKKVQRLRSKLPWSMRSIADYRIFPSVDQVPRFVWYNPCLIVEKFLPECKEGLYCLRTWAFLGDKETNSLSFSKQPIIKGHNIIRREPIAEIPDEIRQMRKDLGFDFGKFDYAIVDGKVVLYDVNRTPNLGTLPKEQYLPNIRLLAEGIRVYL